MGTYQQVPLLINSISESWRELAMMNVDLLQSILNIEKTGIFNFDFSKQESGLLS